MRPTHPERPLSRWIFAAFVLAAAILGAFFFFGSPTAGPGPSAASGPVADSAGGAQGSPQDPSTGRAEGDSEGDDPTQRAAFVERLSTSEAEKVEALMLRFGALLYVGLHHTVEFLLLR